MPDGVAPVHRILAAGRWWTMTFDEQLGNIGSEVSRALRAHARNNEARMHSALERAWELFDLTVADPRNTAEHSELLRAREFVRDFLLGGNHHQSTPESLDAYFLAYALAARHDR